MGHATAPHYGVRLMRYRHPHGRIPMPPGQPDVYVIPPDVDTTVPAVAYPQRATDYPPAS